MRFGQQLRTSLIKDYYYHYIDYDGLKAILEKSSPSKRRKSQSQSQQPKPSTTEQQQPNGSQNHSPATSQWTEDDEKSFVADLETELDKVFTFQRVKAGEIIRRIKASEKEVTDVIAKLDRAAAIAAENAVNGNSNNSEGRRQDNSDLPTEEDFLLLEEDLSDIIADVHDLAKFTQLNYTGFQKIIKKHDKQTKWHLKPVFAARLKAKPFFKYNYDEAIVQLSRLYDTVRTRGNPIKGDSAAGGGQQNFVRQTTKYWVHPDNVTELKLIILKHLPVLVFNPNKEFDAKDSAISSIYYDNPETWELYTGRLKKTEGAEAIRLRWYGGMDTETIFIERKTHREDWTGEKSVKARFSLKEKNVNAFLSGKMTVDQVFEKMRREGKKSEKEIADLEALATEIQYRVLARGYVPVTRSFYNRTAFQLPGDARVRISLDTELTMTREDNLDGRNRAGKNWRRMDIGIDYPFSQLAAEDVERFPYAVLEVKLQTQAGQEPPEWVRELISSHLVEAVPKFSKFIHGTATLFPTRIHLWPFWMPQMDVDIRKPITHRFGIERPGQSASYSTSEDNLDEDSDDEAHDEEDEDQEEDSDQSHTLRGPPTDSATENTRRLRTAQEAIDQNHLDRARDYSTFQDGQTNPNELDMEERLATAPLIIHESNPDDYPLYDSDDETPEDPKDAIAEARRRGDWWLYARKMAYHRTVAISSFLFFGLSKILPTPKPTPIPASSADPTAPLPPNVPLEAKRFKAPPGKRIHVPVRVEPKVQFATERTFLSWLEFSIVLGGIAATLLNFGDSVALASAWAFTLVACASLMYSLGVYLWRVRMIRGRRAVRYHDQYGPTVLCFGILGAVAVNFGLRIANDRGNVEGTG
ncbi:vacuolar transporter chaperone [Agyrium rufum]|nr:vacuolar transporter chaperone [Agyrium rufum]